MTKNSQYEVFRQSFQALTKHQKAEYIQSLTQDDLLKLYRNPELFLFDKQIVPEGDWRYCIMRCGRRFGKSVAGSAWIAKHIYNGAKTIGLCGPTYSDVETVMIPNIRSWFPTVSKPKYNQKDHILRFSNGAICYCLTSDNDQRGKSLEYLWLDEIGTWCDGGTNPEKVKDRFMIIDTACSVGRNPQTLITSTPKPFPLWLEWQKLIDNGDPDYCSIRGTMFDNPYLSDRYRQSEIKKYGNSRLGKQEIWGDLLTDTPGALWTHDMLELAAKFNPPRDKDGNAIYIRIVIAVDPAVSNNANSDETGIMVVALAADGNCYVLEDCSGKYSPDSWAKKVNQLYKQYQADRVVCEKNMGGELVAFTLKTVNPFLPITLVHASKGKILRAEPVAALYEQSKVFHKESFIALETEMTTYTGNSNEKSPNRLDSLVYGITELVLTDQYVNRGGFNNLPYF